MFFMLPEKKSKDPCTFENGNVRIRVPGGGAEIPDLLNSSTYPTFG